MSFHQNYIKTYKKLNKLTFYPFVASLCIGIFLMIHHIQSYKSVKTFVIIKNNSQPIKLSHLLINAPKFTKEKNFSRPVLNENQLVEVPVHIAQKKKGEIIKYKVIFKSPNINNICQSYVSKHQNRGVFEIRNNKCEVKFND